MPTEPDGLAATYVGLRELRKDLKIAEADPTWAKELGRANREVSKDVADWSRSAAQSMGGPFAHFSGSIVGRATQTGARIEVKPVANATFWGAERRTGWNAGHGGAPQHPHWVGANWSPGGPGGPYAINPTIQRHGPQIDDRFAQVIDRITAGAFPDGAR